MKKNLFVWGIFFFVFTLFAEENSNFSLLMDGESLYSVRKNRDVIIVDFGRSREDYDKGHIEGAVYIPKDTVWQEVNHISGMFPGEERTISALGAMGISSEKPVVIYDASGDLWASRLFWALEYLGHQDVHLLDGGIQGWTAEGYPLSTEAVVPVPAIFEAEIREELLISKEDILSGLDSGENVIVDTRSMKEYSGEDVRSAKGGHIPGATHIEWTQNIRSDDQYFLSVSELTELYDFNGVEKDDSVVTLCQTGVRGAHTYFVLRYLGYQDVALYDGSWAEWGNIEGLPIATGGE